MQTLMRRRAKVGVSEHPTLEKKNSGQNLMGVLKTFSPALLKYPAKKETKNGRMKITSGGSDAVAKAELIEKMGKLIFAENDFVKGTAEDSEEMDGFAFEDEGDDDDDDDDLEENGGLQLSEEGTSDSESETEDEDNDGENSAREEIQVQIDPKVMESFTYLSAPQGVISDTANHFDGLERLRSVSSRQNLQGILSRSVTNSFGHDPTVWFEYPHWLGMNRPILASQNIEEIENPKLNWKCYWERNCLKDVLQQAGFQGGKVEGKKASSVGKNCQLIWTKHLKNWKELGKYQRHNHFPGSWCIGRKDRLAMTISKKVRTHGVAYKFLPESFVLPVHADRLRLRIKKGTGKEAWIRKPLASSQGRGIKVLSTRAVNKLVHPKVKGKPASNKAIKACVIQRYVDRPLLINGFKFDVRVYVAVTSFNPLRIYMFPEGLARFCTSKYSNKNKKDQFRHLTNYSINKKSTAFQHNTDANNDSVGSKWSLSALLRYLDDRYGQSTKEKILKDMEAVIVKTIISADDEINAKQVPNQESCFELFGFDLMIDRVFRVWLVEVNISPSLMTASPLDKRVKTILICDTLNLVGIPVRDGKPGSSEGASVSSRRTSSSSKSAQDVRKSSKSEGPGQPRNRNVLNLPKKVWSGLAAEDKLIVEKVVAENERRGHFKRLFPPENDTELHAEYLQLFTAQRYNNVLVQHFENRCGKT